MTSNGLSMRPFNGGVRIYADPRIGNGSRHTDKANEFELGQESTSFLSSAKSVSNVPNAKGRLAMNNANYEQSFPIQYSEKNSKRKVSCGDIPSTQPKQTCTTFRHPVTRKSGVIRIDAREYSAESADSEGPTTAMTLPRAMNPIHSFPGTTTIAAQKQSGTPSYVQRNASKTSLYAPASISHTIAMTTPPPTNTPNAACDLPPPPNYGEPALKSTAAVRQPSASNIVPQVSYDYNADTGTMRRSQPATANRGETVVTYPSPYAETLQFKTNGKNGNQATNTENKIAGFNNKTFSSSSISASVKDTAQHPSTRGTGAKSASIKSPPASDIKNYKSGRKGKDTGTFQLDGKRSKKTPSKEQKGAVAKLNRKTLCCMIFLLLILLLVAVVMLIYFGTNYQNLSTTSMKKNPAQPPKLFSNGTRRTTLAITNKIPKSTTMPKQADLNEVCVTPNCVQAAGVILQKMNKTADPCEDFYEYSCGGWLSSNYMPPDKSNYGIVSEIALANERLLYEVLIKSDRDAALSVDLRARKNSNITEAEKKAQAFFLSCIDITFINQLGPQPMLDMISSMGGWYALEAFDETSWDMDRLLYIVQGQQSASVFFSMSIQESADNETRKILRLDADGATIPYHSFYLYDTTPTGTSAVMVAYKELIRTILTLLRARDINTVIDDIYKFEKQLAQIISSSVEADQFLTIEELNQICPTIKWYVLLKNIIRKQPVSANTQVAVNSQEYMERLSKLMANSSARTIHNYMMWRAVVNKASYMSTPFREAMNKFSSVLHGSMSEPPLWQQCMKQVENHFRIAIGAMFARQGFSPENKLTVEKMVENIKNSFRMNLGRMKWMDAGTRKKALNKLNTMTVEVGYPENLLNDSEFLNSEYDFAVDERSYFNNILNSIKHKIAKRVDTLLTTQTADLMTLSPQTMNAFYSPTINRVFFPAGLLQTPLFDTTFPEAFNYGGIGSMIGHEITHGYDELGKGYDVTGSYKLWWSKSTEKKYSAATSCTEQYYSKYSIGDLVVNGKYTLNENIADISGLKVSHMAYRKWRSRNRIRNFQQLPGTGLTDEQLFFVGYAQTWCMKRLPLSYRAQVLQDHHAPEKFRVLGGVSQYSEFAKVFGCPRNSPMNPQPKCSVW